MAYLHTLPTFKALEKLFSEHGYALNVDLSNEIEITKEGDEETLIDYFELPSELQMELDKFQKDNNLY